MKGIEEYVTECSIMKVKGSEMLDYVVDEAVQIYGGYGYIEEYPAERYYRDSRVARIYEGTNEINRMLITGMLVRKAMKGELPLLEAAKKLQSELLESSMDEGDTDGLLGEEGRLIRNVKKVVVLTAGVAVQRFMTDLDNQQGVLAGVADIITEAYGLESARLRALKMASARGEAGAERAVKMTRLYVYDTLGKIELSAREVLASCAEGDELRTLLAALRRLTRCTPIDTLGLRLEIADHFIAKATYEI
jgi:alkylation response protein AidB-like acyl-CoA dehydrogenase